MQNGFFDMFKKLYPAREKVVRNINALREIFRQNDDLVAFAAIVHKKDGSTIGLEAKKAWNVEGSREAGIIPELAPVKGETVLKKTRFSAFHRTGLAEFIRKNKVTEVYITGQVAGMCVINTSLDCYNHDIPSKVVTDAVMDTTKESVKFFSGYFHSLGIGIKTGDYIKQNPISACLLTPTYKPVADRQLYAAKRAREKGKNRGKL
ncbi:MAG: hypothetical protein A2X35_10140 [Elusimicrobia bacterium GWA2_61_42]|nr:MAG: hypothetical protein A2X35_10140 [Elusimicrobia bacterium GWA2_61_42]OGR76671.1 MAG: hypothetical protein A2X38_03790 [Elusimicrobia bacterium GWC2_61_25]